MNSEQNKAAKPRIFIGSSREGLETARAIQDALFSHATPIVWEDGFPVSKIIITQLLEHLSQSDFGIFVLSPDDVVSLRGEKVTTARDNVILELGLYLGQLGLERTFFVAPEGDENFRLPSDLDGVISGKYKSELIDSDPRTAVAPACNQIRRQIKKLGLISRVRSRNDKEIGVLDDSDVVIMIRDWLIAKDIGYEPRTIAYADVDKDLALPAGMTKGLFELAALQARLKIDQKAQSRVVVRCSYDF